MAKIEAVKFTAEGGGSFELHADMVSYFRTTPDAQLSPLSRQIKHALPGLPYEPKEGEFIQTRLIKHEHEVWFPSEGSRVKLRFEGYFKGVPMARYIGMNGEEASLVVIEHEELRKDVRHA